MSLQSASLPKAQLAHVGAQFTANRLVDGARDILRESVTDAAVLAPMGYDDAWRAQMNDAINAVVAEKSTRENTQSAARPSGYNADAAAQALSRWMNRVEAGLLRSPVEVQQAAPHLPLNWQAVIHLPQAAQTLIDFVRGAAALEVPGGNAASATEGAGLLADFHAKHAAHQAELDKLSPEVLQLHVDEGLLAQELVTLSKVAQKLMPHGRSHYYAVSQLKPGHGAHYRPRVPTPTMPIPAVGMPHK